MNYGTPRLSECQSPARNIRERVQKRKETHKSPEISCARGSEIDAVIKAASRGGAFRYFREGLESEVTTDGCNSDVSLGSKKKYSNEAKMCAQKSGVLK